MAVSPAAPVRSAFGVAAGKPCSTTAVAFASAGVVAPHAGVKSTVWLPLGFWLIPVSGRRWPVPFHVPANEKRVTRRVPLPSKPIDERPGVGVCW